MFFLLVSIACRLQVDWHPTKPGRPFDPMFQTPAVSKRVLRRDADHMWLATGVVPWHCWAMPMPGRPSDLLMLARHWGVMRPLGLPEVPLEVALRGPLVKPSV